MVDGRHVEGFVLEGQNGFMLKIKTAFYTNWKRFRTLKIPLVHNKPVHVGGSEARTVANALVWLSQPANRANAKEDVIRLRDLYWASIGRRPEPATDGDDNGEQGPLSTADPAPAQSPGLPSDSAVSAVPSDDGGTVHELSESKTSSFLGLVQRVHREVVEHKYVACAAADAPPAHGRVGPTVADDGGGVPIRAPRAIHRPGAGP